MARSKKIAADIEIQAGDIVEILTGKDAGFRGMFDGQFYDEAGELKNVVTFDHDEFAYVDSIRFVSRPVYAYPHPTEDTTMTISKHTLLVLAGLEMLATQRALTWAERCAHADLARRVDAVR